MRLVPRPFSGLSPAGASPAAATLRRPVIARSLPAASTVRGLIAALLCASGAALAGCSGEIQCTTEVTTGSASYRGAAVGKSESESLRRDSVREACRQKCAADKAPMVDACTATCTTDVASQKLGAKTTCGRK